MIRRKYLKTQHLNLMILDEADELLSHGFKDQIYKIFQFHNDEIFLNQNHLQDKFYYNFKDVKFITLI